MSTSPSVTNYHALLVDDDPVLRQAMARSLGRAGFHCRLAGTGLEARQLLIDERFDVVITDLKMPGLNGHQLAVEILGQADRPVVIVVTGVTEQKLKDDLRARGIDEIFFKPMDYDNLVARAQSLIAARKKTDRTSTQPGSASQSQVGPSAQLESPPHSAAVSQTSADDRPPAGAPLSTTTGQPSSSGMPTPKVDLPSTLLLAAGSREAAKLGADSVVAQPPVPVAATDPPSGNATYDPRWDNLLSRLELAATAPPAQQHAWPVWLLLTFVGGAWVGWLMAVCAR